jgi:hypothetical protein
MHRFLWPGDEDAGFASGPTGKRPIELVLAELVSYRSDRGTKGCSVIR